MRIFFHYIVDEHNMNFCSADMFEDYMGNNPLPREIKLPLNKDVYTQTMLMVRHQKIAKIFDEEFWGTQ